MQIRVYLRKYYSLGNDPVVEFYPTMKEATDGLVKDNKQKENLWWHGSRLVHVSMDTIEVNDYEPVE